MMTEVEKINALEGAQFIYGILSQMSTEYAMSAVCVALDNVFADRGLSESESVDMYKKMYEAARSCYEQLGTAGSERR